MPMKFLQKPRALLSANWLTNPVWCVILSPSDTVAFTLLFWFQISWRRIVLKASRTILWSLSFLSICTYRVPIRLGSSVCFEIFLEDVLWFTIIIRVNTLDSMQERPSLEDKPASCAFPWPGYFPVSTFFCNDELNWFEAADSLSLSAPS